MSAELEDFDGASIRTTDPRPLRVTDNRQVYAKDTREGSSDELFYLPEEMADEFRDDARAGHLICPVEGCRSPQFTTRGGSMRHHFMHLNSDATSHDFNAIHEKTSLHVIERHFRRKYPTAEISQPENKLADLVVESPRTGLRIGICVYFRPVNEDQLRDRVKEMRHEGITPNVILGAVKRYLSWDRHGVGDKCNVRAAHRTVLDLYDGVLLINPNDQQLATMEFNYGAGSSGHARLASLATLVSFPLDELEIDEDGSLTSAAHRGAVERNERGRQSALAHARRERAPSRFTRLAPWSPAPSPIVAPQDPGLSIHSALTEHTDSQEVIDDPNWKASLYWAFIDGKIGSKFEFIDLVDFVVKHWEVESKDLARIALFEWVNRLYWKGWLEVRIVDRVVVSPVAVIADDRRPPAHGGVSRE